MKIRPYGRTDRRRPVALPSVDTCSPPRNQVDSCRAPTGLVMSRPMLREALGRHSRARRAFGPLPTRHTRRTAYPSQASRRAYTTRRTRVEKVHWLVTGRDQNGTHQRTNYGLGPIADECRRTGLALETFANSWTDACTRSQRSVGRDGRWPRPAGRWRHYRGPMTQVAQWEDTRQASSVPRSTCHSAARGPRIRGPQLARNFGSPSFGIQN